MASHMSAIGFPVATPTDFGNLAVQSAKSAQQNFSVPGVGSYRLWSPGNGVELWAQLDKENKLIGLHPHFSGRARMQVQLVKRVAHPKDTVLDGAFYAWANPHNGTTTDGDYPFCFSSPDHRLHDNLKLPAEASVQLAAFPDRLYAYDDEKQMRSSGHWTKDMAPESCIPSGTFHPKTGTLDPPNPDIMFCGKVREASKLTNPATGLQFYWALVRTLGGELDVVADPSTVSGTIKTGGIVETRSWMSGRLK